MEIGANGTKLKSAPNLVAWVGPSGNVVIATTQHRCMGDENVLDRTRGSTSVTKKKPAKVCLFGVLFSSSAVRFSVLDP